MEEIVEARKATIAEITGPIREALLSSGSPGLRYRAKLDGLAVELINTDSTGRVSVDLRLCTTWTTERHE